MMKGTMVMGVQSVACVNHFFFSVMHVICIIAVTTWAPTHVGMNWWPIRSSPPFTLLMMLLRRPHMCTRINEARHMNVLRFRFTSATIKGRRDVCPSVLPKDYLTLGAIFWGDKSKLVAYA